MLEIKQMRFMDIGTRQNGIATPAKTN